MYHVNNVKVYLIKIKAHSATMKTNKHALRSLSLSRSFFLVLHIFILKIHNNKLRKPKILNNKLRDRSNSRIRMEKIRIQHWLRINWSKRYIKIVESFLYTYTHVQYYIYNVHVSRRKNEWKKMLCKPKKSIFCANCNARKFLMGYIDFRMKNFYVCVLCIRISEKEE